MTLLRFWQSHAAEFASLFGQHVVLVGIATLVATAFGVPLGILAARRPRTGAPIVWVANVAQTIPSLAMFGFLLPLPFIGGLGARVAIVGAHRVRAAADHSHDGGRSDVGRSRRWSRPARRSA